ncbi:hypothetical protein DL764_001572 [Monosporascus ibericus]|uniref:Amine oxidase domain-containing protein n=1 Tax=Monosporascus ibericus TaxID=155417 RepID=A0A4Q4TNX4_9PEZI|nr:hypothetical protein DL764_001572 [Monosporascus ibericus]
MVPQSPARRVAIVGGGIAGIACSWELRKQDCTVDIYESESRLGGHANSVPFKGTGKNVDVDTGFIAMDEVTYPQFSTFLKALGVNTIPTDMSFAVSTGNGLFEWSSSSLTSFICNLSRLLNPWFWRLMFDIVRFYLFAQDILFEEATASKSNKCMGPNSKGANTQDDNFRGIHLETIGDYLRRNRYSDQFRTYFLVPMVAAPWCIDTEDFERSFPAKPLIRFIHGLLDTLTRRLEWRSFRNGSKTYVDAFRRSLPPQHRLHLNGSCRAFDYVVLAVHANQALNLIGNDATSLERELLSCFKTSKNVCYLHSDASHLPRRASARAAWNCFLDSSKETNKSGLAQSLPDESGSRKKISITFDMNKLQAIPFPGEPGSPGRVLVSMNPIHIPYSHQSSHVYYHPLISSESILMARNLHLINGVSNIGFAGAWMGFGFHEDGFKAGVHAARTFVDGWHKTPPLDLTADTMGCRVTRLGFAKIGLRMGVLVVQQLLDLKQRIAVGLGRFTAYTNAQLSSKIHSLW